MATGRKKRKAKKSYRFQLTLSGIIGIGVVSFCLFLWMFLLGIWAGQTILLPVGEAGHRGSKQVVSSGSAAVPVNLLPEARKKAGSGE